MSRARPAAGGIPRSLCAVASPRGRRLPASLPVRGRVPSRGTPVAGSRTGQPGALASLGCSEVRRQRELQTRNQTDLLYELMGVHNCRRAHFSLGSRDASASGRVRAWARQLSDLGELIGATSQEAHHLVFKYNIYAIRPSSLTISFSLLFAKLNCQIASPPRCEQRTDGSAGGRQREAHPKHARGVRRVRSRFRAILIDEGGARRMDAGPRTVSCTTGIRKR